jgi:YopX protein
MNRLKYRAWITPWGSDTSPYMHYIKDLYLNVVIGNWERGGYKDAVFQQYTGLKDSKGNEIYEGDIVKYHFTSPDVNWVDLVAWEHYGWVLLHFDGTESGATPLVPIPSMEIIGNIFENKDLLNL